MSENISEVSALKKFWPPDSTSWVWQHCCLYTPDPSKPQSRRICCMHCGQTYNYDTSTSTASDHLKRYHKLVDLSAFFENKGKVSNQTLLSFQKPLPKSQTEKINDALLEFLGKDALPPNLVRGAGFRAFVHALNSQYEAPDPRTLKTRLRQKRFEVEAEVRSYSQIYCLNINIII